MTKVITAVLIFALLCGLARWANARFRRENRLPMQWSLTGDVTWFAPRRVALAIIPASAVPAFAMLILLPPRPGQEGMVLPALIGIGVTLVGIQLLHFWLIERSLRKNGS